MKKQPPTVKTIGGLTVSVATEAYPHWTRIADRGTVVIALGHEEARDLHYALTRVIAFLDARGV